jgi:hypothetical protein
LIRPKLTQLDKETDLDSKCTQSSRTASPTPT